MLPGGGGAAVEVQPRFLPGSGEGSTAQPEAARAAASRSDVPHELPYQARGG